MQESINKDPEELKNKHTETNNTNTEIKNTLEGINIWSRRMNLWAEEKMVEITSEEQNKVKTMKRVEDSLRHLGPYQTHKHSNYRGTRRRIEKERVWETFWRHSWKFPQHGKGNSQSSPRGTKSPIQDKSKEKHAKTYTNKTNKE